MNKKKDSSILITGSSRGIGAALARVCKQEGFEVILHGRSKSKDLLNLAKELNSQIIYFDVTNEIEMKNSLKQLKKLNILINCAGINISKPFNDLSKADWQSVYDVNVFGLVNVIKYTYPILKKNKLSKIINISSIKGIHSSVGRAAYASSKASVINITSSLAKEFAPKIIVNCVSPGFIVSDMTSKLPEKVKEQLTSRIPMARLGNGDDVSNCVAFLSSEASSYITGETIHVNGGMYMA